jgi:predicted NACHT family NTPase
VLFHLSTWAEQPLALLDWLIDEFDKRYDVPPGAGRACLANGRILLLLDGLDEVAPAHRARCVEAINAFRKHCDLIPIVICSRLADYEALRVRLRLAGAVVIQALSRQQIDDYLERAGPPLAGVRRPAP